MTSPRWARAALQAKLPTAGQLAVTRIMLLPLALLEIAHRPTAVLVPQLYAEDGADSYAAAYNHGLASLPLPIAGYWQGLNRVLGLVSAGLSLQSAAILFTAVGIIAALLPAAILLWSGRAHALVPDHRLRVAVAVAYVCVQPPELRFSATNAQWHLVLAALLLILLPLARSRASRAAELILVGITATSGPLGAALLPVAAMQAWRRRDRHSLALLGVLVAGAAVETVTYLVSSQSGHDPRHSGNTGSSLALLPQLLVTRVFVSLAGRPGSVPGGSAGILVACALALPVVAAAIWRGPALLRWTLVVAIITLALGLEHPYTTFRGPVSIWFGMLYMGSFQRYFFLADLAWVGTLLWLATRLRPHLRTAACAAVVLSSLALGLRGWSDPIPHPVDLGAQQARLDAARRGSAVVIPITPAGWEMRLIRH